MANLSEVDAAIHTGFSVELLKALTSYAPKIGESVKLKFQIVDDRRVYASTDLDRMKKYLLQPWPEPSKGGRAPIPSYIQQDVKVEAGCHCALCGTADACEYAHIDEYCKSKNNSPDNLIYLCSTHHSQYDGKKTCFLYDEVGYMKNVLRCRRVRMLRYESDFEKYVIGAMAEIKRLEKSAAAGKIKYNESLVAVRNLAKDVKKKITDYKNSPSAKLLTESFVSELENISSENSIELEQKKSILNKFDELLDEKEMIACPRCEGQGFYVSEDVCKFCSGAMFVEKTSADSYNPDDYGGICCPRCEGIGFEYDGERCKFCLGEKLVLTEKASSYNADNFDEVRCPRCNGDGCLFLGHECEFCNGSGKVLARDRDNYDCEDYELVRCSVCKGEGKMDISGRPECGCCGGNGWTNRSNIENYDPTEHNLQRCPHCDGRGCLWDGSGCDFCGGDGLVSDEKMATYDESQFDYPCPLCAEEKKYDGEVCPLCGGESRISYDTLQKYNEGYFWD